MCPTIVLSINQDKSGLIWVGTNGGVSRFYKPANKFYYFTKDTAEKSNCSGACANIWPAFFTENIIVSSPLQKADFGEITSGGGAKQITYKGQPLYYYSGDANAGDTNGNGFNGLWFLVKP